MTTNRRQFLATAVAGTAAAALPLSSRAAHASTNSSREALQAKYAKLDAVLAAPVLKRRLFSSPVIIETLELLRFQNSFICHVRSKDGAEGYSVSNNAQ